MPSAKEIISTHKYVMLSKSWCPDCHYAINVFNKYKVLPKIHLVELDKMDPAPALKLEKEFTQISGRKWVPSLFFNGKFWGNESDLYRLESTDKIEESFKAEGLL
ncbi:glutathione-disulfide reductase [Martiniozyma asiatica (nom. inval.)]|nr:glutathione-disulfide reductase [Martiniozyma asiatica]